MAPSRPPSRVARRSSASTTLRAPRIRYTRFRPGDISYVYWAPGQQVEYIQVGGTSPHCGRTHGTSGIHVHFRDRAQQHLQRRCQLHHQQRSCHRLAASELATGNYAAWGTWAATARPSRPSRPSGLCAGIGRGEAAYSSRVLQVRHAVSNRSLMPAPLLTSSGRRAATLVPPPLQPHPTPPLDRRSASEQSRSEPLERISRRYPVAAVSSNRQVFILGLG